MKYRENHENANIIIRIFRGYLIRKKTKSEMLKRRKAALLITKLFKNFFYYRNKQKELAAIKIQLLLRRNSSLKKKQRNLEILTNKWLQGKNAMNRNYAAVTVQRYFRSYKQRKLFEHFSNLKLSSKLEYNLLQSKFCYICNSINVSYYCIDCGGNHYCTEDFLFNHSNKSMKNHSYMTIVRESATKNNIGNTINLNNKNLNKLSNVNTHIDLSMINLKSFLKKNHINLHDHFKYWDYENNGQIKYKHLVYSLNYKFFNFPIEYSKILVDFALKFVGENKNIYNLDDCYVNYENMCLEL